MSRPLWILVAVALIGFAVLPSADVAAKKKKKTPDRTWTSARFDSFEVDRIAMLPVASYDNDFTAEKLVEGALGRALRGTGYRWISATTTRDGLRAAGGDSLLKVVNEQLLEHGRVDSLTAPELCDRFHCDALLSARVEQWEKHEMEWNQSGKPTTSVQVSAALVDSTGALLWTAAGSQTGEGPYHNASSNPIGMTGGALQQQPITGQGGAPEYLEVVGQLLERWVEHFPARRAGSGE